MFTGTRGCIFWNITLNTIYRKYQKHAHMGFLLCLFLSSLMISQYQFRFGPWLCAEIMSAKLFYTESTVDCDMMHYLPKVLSCFYVSFTFNMHMNFFLWQQHVLCEDIFALSNKINDVYSGHESKLSSMHILIAYRWWLSHEFSRIVWFLSIDPYICLYIMVRWLLTCVPHGCRKIFQTSW